MGFAALYPSYNTTRFALCSLRHGLASDGFRCALPILQGYALCALILLLMSGCGILESSQEKAERFYQSGMAAVEAGKNEEAFIHFQNALQKDPYHAKAHYRLGNLYVLKNELYPAVRELSTAVRQDPNFKEPRQALAMLSYQNEAYDQTVSFCRELIEKWGNDLETLLLWGDSLLRLNKSAEAREVLEKAVSAFPADPKVKILFAQALLREKAQENALREMRAAAALAPKDITVQISLARFYETINKLEDAEKKFLEICNAFPGEPNGFLTTAQFYLRRQRLDQAEAVIEKALGSNLRDPRLYQTAAQVHHTRKNYDKALNSLKSAVSASNESQAIRSSMLLADYYIFLKRIPQALETYEAMLKKNPSLVGAKIRIAELLLSENRNKEAQQKIDEILAEHSDSSGGLLLKGLLDLKEGRIPEAKKAFLTSRSLSPDSPDPYYYYGLTFLMEGDFNQSLPEMLAALDKNPDSRLVRLAVAYIYFQNRKHSQALNLLDKILADQPEDFRARSLRGSVYQRMGNHQAASSDYRRIVDQNPKPDELPLFRFRLAETYQSLGKKEEAVREYASILDSHPAPIRPLERIVRIHLAAGNHEKALSLCDEYQKKLPKDPELTLLKAEVLVHQGKFQVAEGILRTLVQGNPNSDKAFFLYGRLHERSGNFKSAAEMYQKVVQLNPNHRDAHVALAATLQRLGRLEEAVSVYETLLSKTFFAPAANDLAYLYAELDQKLDRALELAEKARDQLSDRPEVADTIGWIHYKRKSYSTAKRNFNAALASRPKEPIFHYHLALADYEENNFPKAIQGMKTALQLGLAEKESRHASSIIKDSEDVENRMRAAEGLAKSGKLPEAVALYEELVKRGGFYAPAAIGLARALTQKGENFDRAQELAEKVRAVLPSSAEAADIQGWILMKKGSTLLAKKHLHDAIQFDPRNGRYRYHLGAALHMEKDFREAEKELRSAISLGLQGEELESAKKLLEAIPK